MEESANQAKAKFEEADKKVEEVERGWSLMGHNLKKAKQELKDAILKAESLAFKNQCLKNKIQKMKKSYNKLIDYYYSKGHALQLPNEDGIQ